MNQLKNKNGQFAVHETQRLNKEIVTITGTLTSRIESRQDYYYAFLKSPNLVDKEWEFPVIFKNQEGYYKPDLKKGTQIQLTGFWSPGKDRPSFTGSQYKLLKDPDPPTFQSLQQELSSLLRPSLEKKKEWAERVDFLFKKQKDLQEDERNFDLWFDTTNEVELEPISKVKSKHLYFPSGPRGYYLSIWIRSIEHENCPEKEATC